MLKVVGYEHRAGHSKSKNRDYSLSIAYCEEDYPIETDGGVGHRVEVVIINELLNGAPSCIPEVGRTLRPLYNRQGFVCDWEML